MSKAADRRAGDRRRNAASEKPAVERRGTDRRSAADRRRYVRAPMDLWVEEEQGEDLYFRRVGNLSIGGVYFENAIPHKPGTAVTVKFSVPGHERIIEARAEVVNAQAGSSGSVGMGVKFHHLDPRDRELLASYIQAVSSGPQPAIEDA